MPQKYQQIIDGPAIVVHQSDDLGWDIGQVGGNPNKAIAVLTR